MVNKTEAAAPVGRGGFRGFGPVGAGPKKEAGAARYGLVYRS